MPSALEIVLVAAAVALFLGASRMSGAMRDAGRWAGRLRRTTGAPPAAAGEEPASVAALPRPPHAG